jgi:hypothetical protein
MVDREVELRLKLKEEMRRERDAVVNSEKLESAKLLKEYQEREAGYSEELIRLRNELEESSRALVESSEVQRELVRYRKEVRRLEELNKKAQRELEMEREEGHRQLQVLNRKNAKFEAEVRVERERGRRLRGEIDGAATTAELDAVLGELENSVQNVRAMRAQRHKEEQNYLQGEQQQKLCVICLTEPKVCLLVPCRHLCVCEQCGLEVQQCPVCRTHIKERTLVYL